MNVAEVITVNNGRVLVSVNENPIPDPNGIRPGNLIKIGSGDHPHNVVLISCFHNGEAVLFLGPDSRAESIHQGDEIRILQ